MAARITRSRAKQPSQVPDLSARSHEPLPGNLLLKEPGLSGCDLLPSNMRTVSTGMRKANHDVMLLKRSKLRNAAFQASLHQAETAQAAAASLVFAQQEAGTAVCISSEGLILTCAHCICEDNDGGSGVGEMRWLLFASGQVVKARCLAWDPRRDLALLLIIAATARPETDRIGSEDNMEAQPFPYIRIASNPPRLRSPLHCIGHPGSEDLEASTSGIMTDYNVLHISSGRVRGLVEGQDPQDNSEIGALKHDCWTYWGHSGAPLVQRAQHTRGWNLVGLHSSWDDETGMRRGVPLQAIRGFLKEHVHGAED